MNKILFRNYRIALTMAFLSFAIWAHGQATDSVTVKGTIPTHLIKVQEADGTQAHMGQMMGIVDYGDGDSLVSFLPVYFINDSMLVIGTDTLATRAYSRQNATESDPTVPAYAKTLTGASVVLSGLITVDGTGSGLDADLLDGQHGTYYLGIDSLDGVINDGGNIDLVAGSNIIITPDDAANTITIAATASLNGSGTLNYLPKFTPDGNTLGNSQIFDNGTNVGIGITSPTSKLHVSGTGRITSTMQFDAYGNGVNTSGNPVNVLSTDPTGILQSHPVSEVISAAGGVTGSGVANRVAYWSGTNSLTSNSGFTYNGTNLTLSGELYVKNTTFFGTRGVTQGLFMGVDAGLNATGSGNNAFGFHALRSVTTSSNNTAIGAFAGTNSTGAANTYIGLSAGSLISSGDYNTIIGENSARYVGSGFSTTVTGLSNGVYIGRDVRTGADLSSNETVIGAGAIGLGSNTATIGNSSITKLKSRNYIFNVDATPSTDDLLGWDGSEFSPVSPASVVSSGGGTTGTGSANTIAYWTGSSTLTNSSNLTYNGTNLTLGTGTLRIPDGSASLPSLTFGLDADNGLYRTSANVWGLSVNQTPALLLDATGATINNTGADFDFRVKGDTDNDLIRADAGADRVGIGTATPSNKLHVVGGIELDNATVTANEGTIRYSGSDLEGYIGGAWKSLTSSGVSGSGTTGYLSKFTGSSTLGNSTVYDSLGTGQLLFKNTMSIASSGVFANFTSQSYPNTGVPRYIAMGGGGFNWGAISYERTGATASKVGLHSSNGGILNSAGVTVTSSNNVQIPGVLSIGTTDTDAELVIENSSIANVAIRSTTDNLNTFWSLENEAQDNNSYAVYRDGLTENMIIARSVDQPFATLSTTYVEFENGGDVRIHQKIQLGSSGNLFIFWGSGSPEGVVTAAIGSTYHRTDGGSGTSYYVKESGTGNTGWVAK